MATAAARIDDLEEGKLPHVCAKTGFPAVAFARIQFGSTPSWTWILLLFGILPFLIARWFSRVRVFALVPMSDAALRRGRILNWVVGGLVLLGGSLLLIDAFEGPSYGLAGLGATLGGLVLLVVAWPFIWPTGHVEGEWVWLSFVHPDFAYELGRFYNRRSNGP